MSEWSIFWKVLMTGGAVMRRVIGGDNLALQGTGRIGVTCHDCGKHASRQNKDLPWRSIQRWPREIWMAYRYVAVIVVIAFLSIILMNWAALRPVNQC